MKRLRVLVLICFYQLKVMILLGLRYAVHHLALSPVLFKIFKTKDVKNANEGLHGGRMVENAVDGVNQPSEESIRIINNDTTAINMIASKKTVSMITRQ